MADTKRVALYARFSSDKQREESIEAQVMAMTKYAQQHEWEIVETYIDRGISGTTDHRPAFQQMIEDSKKRTFDAVLVHKNDRFARNRYDSALYKGILRKNNIRVFSVLEQISDTPESIILEALLEGLSEFYVANLGREVMKGMTQNALKAVSCGGTPPLGYDLDESKHLIINEHEAEAVRIIYDLYINGVGTTAIADYLNSHGFRTKKGELFSRYSFQLILRNEKYFGMYTFNKVVSKDFNHKRNSNKFKPDDEIIRVPGGCPAIISRETFELAQKRRELNQNAKGRFQTSSTYLCSGVIRCGCCGKNMSGSKRYGESIFHVYRCTSKREVCSNMKEIDSVKIDEYVVGLLEKEFFSKWAMKTKVNRANNRIDRLNHRTENKIPSVSLDCCTAMVEAFHTYDRSSPQFRTLIQKFILDISVERDFVIFRIDLGFGVIPDYCKEFTADRSLFQTPTQKHHFR